jgi:hypothetical protein
MFIFLFFAAVSADMFAIELASPFGNGTHIETVSWMHLTTKETVRMYPDGECVWRSATGACKYPELANGAIRTVPYPRWLCQDGVLFGGIIMEFPVQGLPPFVFVYNAGDKRLCDVRIIEDVDDSESPSLVLMLAVVTVPCLMMYIVALTRRIRSDDLVYN